MTFYLTCTQGQHRCAVRFLYVRIVQGMFVVKNASVNNVVLLAKLDRFVAALSKWGYVLNMLQYDSDSIAYFFHSPA